MIAGLPPGAWLLMVASVVPAFLVALLYWMRNRPSATGRRRAGGGEGRGGDA